MNAQAVLDIFAEINKVPRPSKHEEKMCEWLIHFAQSHHIEYKYMPIHRGATTGNVLMRKPATPGYEKHPAVILQAHMDMVCEKNADCQHDFMKDAIQTYIDEEGWMHAKGTTLGADDGIGDAMMLAVLTASDIPHPALECLFTTDEETGLTGANCLPAGVLKGKRLINLDNEDDGQICMGCAGGVDTLAHLYYKPETAPAGMFAAEIKVSGLMGGHSGEDINKGRANANKLLNRILFNLKKAMTVRIAAIHGGNLRNAIAREASAVILVPMEKKEQMTVIFNTTVAEIEHECKAVEKDIQIALSSCHQPATVLPKAASDKLILAVCACPHGVFSMSREIPGLVQTSTNLASLKMKEDKRGHYIEINTSQRSSIESEKHYLKHMVEAALALSGAKISHGDGYPGWAPNPKSKLLRIVENAWKENEGKKPQVVAIHAGLECGLFLEKYPDLDMVSFGPQMSGVHSPAEKIQLASIERTWHWLLTALKAL